MSDSTVESDLVGLRHAYERDQPYFLEGTLYIPGTRTGMDVVSDMLLASPVFRTSFAYREAERAFLLHRPERVVGHSLGGAVAAYLGKDHGVYNVGYGSPISNDHNYADPRDPVGALVPSNAISNSSFLHHGVTGYNPGAISG
jgi:hypothetical protein